MCKNAFQQDAYGPLVDRIPACTEGLPREGGVPDPPVNRMTDRCKNNTFAPTSLRAVNMVIYFNVKFPLQGLFANPSLKVPRSRVGRWTFKGPINSVPDSYKC